MRQRLVLLLSLLLIACSPAVDPPMPPSEAFPEDAAASAPLVGDDAYGLDDGGSSSTDPTFDGSTAPPGDDATAPVAPAPDASSYPSFDAGPDGTCAAPAGAGDLVVDELMIESVAGAGDYGEWLEVRSTLPCAANIRGLHGESPSGSKVRTFDVSFDLWIPAGGTFVVADSDDPALNHDLPGTVLSWSGHPGDVLRNLGGTVTLKLAGTIVDSVTWPAYKGAIGASIELPADCPASVHADLGRWQQATASWFPGFRGTPNAPNGDVHCP
jgi:hypothetical protein